MTFSLYFLGTEQPAWARTLAEQGVTRMGLSFWSLSHRVRIERVDLSTRFAEGTSVLLESGGYQANADPGRMTVGEWEAYAAGYEAFVERSIEHLDLVTELDCPALGPAWVESRRTAFYDQIPDERFLPVWHPDQGERTLTALIERYGRVSVVASVLDQRGSTVASQLMSAARRHPEMKLHGSALTKMDPVETLPFTSAASSSWISPTRFGDTIVWDGSRLVRYPVRYRDQARTRHRALFEAEGFDADAIAAGDNKELIALTVWSWLRWEAWVNERHGAPVASNSTEVAEDGENPSRAVVAVAAPPAPPKERERELLPLFAVVSAEDEDGDTEQLRTTGVSQRVCDTCTVGSGCPKFQPGFTCGYHLPIEIRTKVQRKAFLDSVNEMQAGRIALMHLREQVNGGYADPNLGQEIDRLMRSMKIQAEIEDDGDYFEMTLRGRRGGAQGALSKIFGADIAAKATELPSGGYTEGEVTRVLEHSVGVAR